MNYAADCRGGQAKQSTAALAVKAQPAHPAPGRGTRRRGFSVPAEDYVDVGIDLNEQLVRHPTSTFFLHVSGNSMTDAGIHGR